LPAHGDVVVTVRLVMLRTVAKLTADSIWSHALGPVQDVVATGEAMEAIDTVTVPVAQTNEDQVNVNVQPGTLLQLITTRCGIAFDGVSSLRVTICTLKPPILASIGASRTADTCWKVLKLGLDTHWPTGFGLWSAVPLAANTDRNRTWESGKHTLCWPWGGAPNAWLISRAMPFNSHLALGFICAGGEKIRFSMNL
jgi:hypothetical protein